MLALQLQHLEDCQDLRVLDRGAHMWLGQVVDQHRRAGGLGQFALLLDSPAINGSEAWRLQENERIEHVE